MDKNWFEWAKAINSLYDINEIIYDKMVISNHLRRFQKHLKTKTTDLTVLYYRSMVKAMQEDYKTVEDLQKIYHI